MSRLRSYWGRLHPRQRELAWTTLFGLVGVCALLLAALALAFWWPGLLEDPALATPGALIGCVVGIGSGVGGMKIGYWLEDRRERRQTG